MRFLLLQARTPDDPAGPHEREAFLEIMARPAEAFDVWSMLDGPPPGKALDSVDCVLVGGSGDFGVGDRHELAWLRDGIDFMGQLADDGFPTFASCFGFQCLVVAKGGTVVSDKARAEVGTFELEVTADGANDPLFDPLKWKFNAQMGHKDHVTELPEGMVHLARSARSEYQALKIPGKPVYATQFHPELSMVRNRERYMRYLESYSDPTMPDAPDDVLAAYRETELASSVLRRYVDEILPRFL